MGLGWVRLWFNASVLLEGVSAEYRDTDWDEGARGQELNCSAVALSPLLNPVSCTTALNSLNC